MKHSTAEGAQHSKWGIVQLMDHTTAEIDSCLKLTQSCSCH